MKHTVPVCGECLLADSCASWLFSLTVTHNPRTALICMKPKVRCTFIGSVVSLLTGIKNKVWLISHRRDWANRRPSWFLAFITLCPLRASRPDHITRGGPNLTTDQTSKLLLITYGCDKAQLQLWCVYASTSIVYNQLREAQCYSTSNSVMCLKYVTK